MTAKTVRKIKLDSKKTAKKEVVEAEVVREPKTKRRAPKAARIAASPVVGTGRYIKGSWDEIRQVRWPSRKATWGMTLAVILFTAFFSIVILLLDGLFQMLFKQFLLK